MEWRLTEWGQRLALVHARRHSPRPEQNEYRPQSGLATDGWRHGVHGADVESM